MVVTGELDMSDLRQIWVSNLIPNGPYVISQKLAGAVGDSVLKLMNWISENDSECTSRIAGREISTWIPITHSDYEAVIKARQFSLSISGD